jgi:starch-binding outer membrane protein, SusD/RagB family
MKSFSSFITRIALPATLLLTVACHKQAFLDAKPSSNLVVPTTLSDFQALLDNTLVMGLTPVLGDVSADNYFVNDTLWRTLDTKAAQAYIWAKDIYEGQVQVPDWDVPYQQVFYANVVLDGLAAMKGDSVNSVQYNTIKGEALFTRSYAFFNIAELFAPPYDSSSASVANTGIPLRETSDINARVGRSTVQATYDTLLSDLQTAVRLLPVAVPFANLNRPSRPAAQALLARIYLSLRNYALAGAYADSALQAWSTLINFNQLDDSTTGIPFPQQNIEILYQSIVVLYTLPEPLVGLYYPDSRIDSGLLRSYDWNDLRRYVFYKTSSVSGYTYQKGGYSGSFYPFTGLATDELYLIRAECAARAGNTGNAMNDINTLLLQRWKTGTFPGYSASSPAEALDTVLLERRKELPFRGVRWSDLRRFNQEGMNIVLIRSLGGVGDTLKPNDENYTLPIPPDVLSLGGIPDNPRH